MNLEEYRGKLLSRLATLEDVAAELQQAEEIVELDQTRVGRVSRMDALQQQAMAKETGARRQMEIKRIHAALGRIEEGTFGDCLRCEEPIAEARLAFDPTATNCIECAEALEKQR